MIATECCRHQLSTNSRGFLVYSRPLPQGGRPWRSSSPLCSHFTKQMIVRRREMPLLPVAACPHRNFRLYNLYWTPQKYWCSLCMLLKFYWNKLFAFSLLCCNVFFTFVFSCIATIRCVTMFYERKSCSKKIIPRPRRPYFLPRLQPEAQEFLKV